MTAKLNAPLKRELLIRGEPHTLTTSPEGLNLVPKGRRKGYRLSWEALVSGDAALATALAASVQHGPAERAHDAKRSATEGATGAGRRPHKPTSH
jgi:hypothetical protein